jgi:hypothetical protein
MRNQNILLTLALVLSAGALIISSLSWRSEEAIAPSSPEEQLTQRVAALEAELLSLQNPNERPQRAMQRASAREERGGFDETIATKVEAAAQAQGLVDENGDTSPEVREKLGEIIREEMMTAREEAMDRRMQRRIERREAMVEEFSENQSLDAEQTAFLTEVMLKEQDQIADLFRLAREDGSWRSARREAREIRDESNQSLSEMLTEEQMEAWSEAREESRPGSASRSNRRTSSSDD